MSEAGENYSKWLHETGGSEAVECYVEELEKQNEDLSMKLYRKDKEIEQLKKYIDELHNEK